MAAPDVDEFDAPDQPPAVPGQSTERTNEMFCFMTHSTHFTYGYMVSDIW